MEMQLKKIKREDENKKKEQQKQDQKSPEFADVLVKNQNSQIEESKKSDPEENSNKKQKENKKIFECKGTIVKDRCGQTIIEKLYIYDYYEAYKIIGMGAYGVVCSGKDCHTNELVAIKKVKLRLFVCTKYQKRLKMLSQIQLMLNVFFVKLNYLVYLFSILLNKQEFLKHKNIVKLVDIIKPDSYIFNDVYLVFEYMQADLDKILTDFHIQKILYTTLCGLNFMHLANVIHRDIKPNNILINSNCECKIGDLGLARKFEYIEQITDYVVTRWYRAPEIILSSSEYTKSIDIWSIGCIFAELLGRITLFCGMDYISQLTKIIAIMGTPNPQELPYTINEQNLKFINSLPKRNPQKWETLYPQANPLALDLLNKMLVYNPNQRYTTKQCLEHKYLEAFYVEEVLECKGSFDWSFDEIQLKKEVIQRAIYDEAVMYHPEKDDKE